MTPWFNDVERIARLNAAAGLWIDTPWAPNSSARGPDGGVSCSNLPASIYRDCGWLPADWPAPGGDPQGTRFGGPGVIQPWLDSRPEFEALPTTTPLACGDLVGFRFWHGVDHLGLVLAAYEDAPTHCIHVLQHSRTTLVSLADPTWKRRLIALWRPIDFNPE